METVWAAVLAGAFGVVGTMLGLIFSSKSAVAQERQRWEREDQLRFVDRKLAACQDFAISAVQLSTYMAAHKPPATPVVEAFVRSEQMISFLCSRQVRLSAAKIRLLLDAAQAGVNDVPQFTEHLRLLRLEFENSLREELGLPKISPDALFADLARAMGLDEARQ